MVTMPMEKRTLNRLVCFWREQCSFRGAILLVLLSYFSLNVLGIYVKGWGPLYDQYTFLILAALCIALGYATIRSDHLSFLVIMSVNIFFILMIFPKLTAYLWFPDQIHISHLKMLGFHVPWPSYYPVGTDIVAINHGLLFILLGLFCFLLGIFVVGKLMGILFPSLSESTSTPVHSYAPSHLLIVFFVFAGISLYLTVWLGNSVYSDVLYGAKHKLVGVLTHLFSFKSVMTIALVSLFAMNRWLWKDSLIVASMIVAYAVASSLGGSRATPYELVIFVSGALIALYGNYRTSIRNYMLFSVIVIMAIIVSWPLGTYVRDKALQVRDSVYTEQQGKSAVEKQRTPTEVVSQKQEVARQAVDNNIFRILDRLCDLDYVILTIATPGNPELESKYMNVGYALKSAINIIVPGKVFDDAEINTAFLWPFVYANRDTHLLENKRYYETLPWTSWGLVYVMFGWLGGLVAMFFAGVAFNGANMMIRKYCGRYRPYLLMLWFVFSFSFLGAMGMDDYLVGVFGQSLYLVVALFCLAMLTMFADRLPLRSARRAS